MYWMERAMAFDFKREYREFYMPKDQPEIIHVPPMNYIAVRGQGNPNTEDGAYQQAIGILYAVAYTLKMSYKTGYRIEASLTMWYRRWRASGRRKPEWRPRMPFNGFL